ncbi:ribosome biogenesis protein ytm-1 [Colletotrichum truncatum]|uniref:Ribosome biogenesis protein ytm-1 n=1 Tax=Colletotrichum truncatum TaxID=5467 RepID=A0ACC3ZIE2_COLTU|nr:ribosome biogenesis protein ytm-1 [Colletotrichum truncatum]KAF6785691.1 ribosome biogenesis protein ytm-1 [Colletotrichum truncatum]
MESSVAQVKVNFTTTHEDLQLDESKRQLLVPADIKRYGLSRILNSESMLNTSSPVPLDFLVNGNFLRTTIEEYLQSNGLSSESTITLQYVRSLLPPVYEASFEHDDWVAAVDVLSATSPAGIWSGDALTQGQDRILSASYDGLVRIWDGSGQCLATSASARAGGHSKLLSDAKFLSSTQIASVGLDQKVVVWKYTESADRFSGELKPTLELHGHKKMINSLDVHGPSKRMLTASADGRVGLWVASKKDSPEVDVEDIPTKRAKTAGSSVSVPQRGAKAMINAHEGASATAVAFKPADKTVAYSASTDHTLRTLDLETASVVSTLTTLHPLLCIAPMQGSSSLVAAGSAARHVTLLDPRASAQATSVLTLRGHTNMVSALAPSPDNEYSLASGSHDGTVKIWDLRSVRPATKDEGGGSVSEAVYTIGREWLKGKKAPLGGEGAKVFGLAWDKTWGIVSGGEDKKVQINRGRDLVSS